MLFSCEYINDICFTIIAFLTSVSAPSNTGYMSGIILKFDAIDISAMDFPKDWESSDIWNAKS